MIRQMPIRLPFRDTAQLRTFRIRACSRGTRSF
jgi:hypothetical protein